MGGGDLDQTLNERHWTAWMLNNQLKKKQCNYHISFSGQKNISVYLSKQKLSFQFFKQASIQPYFQLTFFRKNVSIWRCASSQSIKDSEENKNSDCYYTYKRYLSKVFFDAHAISSYNVRLWNRFSWKFPVSVTWIKIAL